MNCAICLFARIDFIKPLAVAVLFVNAAVVQSSPVFENASGGLVVVSHPNSKSTVVTQEGRHAVANWREFSVGKDETVQFIQESSNAVILNRVTGEDVSTILGTLQANGRVFLINPNGILFGANSQVNVNGLVASTLSLKPGERSSRDEIDLELIGQAGTISSRGSVRAKDIVLIAPRIENAGEMNAEGRNATAQFIAASEVRLNTQGDNMVPQVLAASEKMSIEQLGSVTAEGGRIVFMAISSSGGVSSAINISNVNRASEISIQGDLVRLSGEFNREQTDSRLDVSATHIEQAGALKVGGKFFLSGGMVNLATSARNTFEDEVDLNLTGEARIRSAADLVIGGNALNLEATAKDSLTVLKLSAHQITLDAKQIQLKQVTAGGDLILKSAKIGQQGPLKVEGQTTLSAGEVDLKHAENNFIGQVLVQADGTFAPRVSISDANSLTIRGSNFHLSAVVQGSLDVQANGLNLGESTVVGDSKLNLTGALTQSGSVSLNDASLKADRIVLNDSRNRFKGVTHLDSEKTIELGAAGNLTAQFNNSSGAVRINVEGDATLNAEHIELGPSHFGGNLVVNSNRISQTASSQGLEILGETQLNAMDGTIDLQNQNNQFNGNLSAHAEQTNISAKSSLRLLNLSSGGGLVSTDNRLLLLGNIEQGRGSLSFAAHGTPSSLSSSEIAMLLPPSLDVYSSKEAVNPVTGLGRIGLASPIILQKEGQIRTASGAQTQFFSSQNGSLVLAGNNRIHGQVSALAGQFHSQPFSDQPVLGASLFAVNNDVKLLVGTPGVEADLMAIRTHGLATLDENSVIRARMPYNNIAVGTSRSYPGLTLSIPLNEKGAAQSLNGSLGTSSGAIRVEVGDTARLGLGGFIKVLPFEGKTLLPGLVVYLTGPERGGVQSFFYEGAQNLVSVPVVYNGNLLLSPQENAALTSAQGAVVLARQEHTRSVIRTENIAEKIINGVLVEVGPGRPATEGAGGAGKPPTCEAESSALICKQ